MDSVRSEYSDASSTPGTSRFGGGGSSGAFSSFIDSSSFNSSRGSTTRSDFVSNFEQKFLERKTEKKKKREREKRIAAETSNQLTSDDKRRADREAERLQRKAEMAAWLPDKETLLRAERNHKRQSNAKFRDILGWYPPLEREETNEKMTSKEVAIMLEHRKNRIEIHPFFSLDTPHMRDAHRVKEQQALGVRIANDTETLRRRVVDLHQKVSYIENHPRCEVRPSEHRRQPKHLRSSRSVGLLAPLPGSRSPARPFLPGNHVKSMRNSRVVSMSHFFRDTPEEEARALEAETAAVDMFLDFHKRRRRCGGAACVIQSAWRMFRQRRIYKKWRRWRMKTRRAFFQVWVLSHRITKQAQRSAKAKYFRAWREEVDGAIRLQLIELQLFREAETQPELPKIVINLVFMTDEDDDAYTRKVLTHPMKQSYYTGFVNAAFAPVEQLAAMTSKNRVRILKAQHLEARRAIAKRIVQRMFLLWKRVHAEEKRIGLNAQLCIKRAARMAFQHRPVWAGEKMLTIIELWARWAAFSRSKRLHIPMPHFVRPLPLWDVWLHNYHERQVRKVKAATKAPLARMKRCFRSFRAFAAFALHMRLTNEAAEQHFRSTRSRAVLLQWWDAIAESAFHKKLSRSVLHQWQVYAYRKVRMRPWKRQVIAARLRREQLRAWAAWRHVQLRSCFKRELYRSRLTTQPKWRWKVQRLLLVWMDIRWQLHKWKLFVGWKHWVQRRKLFLTLQHHCVSLRRRHLLYGMFGAWKAVVWKQEEEFLEDCLRLSAWDAYKELSPLVSMLFYGCYSDAAAIFGGVPSEWSNAPTAAGPSTSVTTDSDDDELTKRQQELQAHHVTIVQGSVVEVRNLILKCRHLINGVDLATGNTALHVAVSQIEDPVRRFDVVGLLLCEGATSWDKPNRHGLSPKQLAPDDLTKELLERGVYGFYSRGVLQRARDGSHSSAFVCTEPAETRLLWCLIAIMSAEYSRGDRISGDIQREWYSELKDELWLRRGRICFASASAFSASVQRCRAFLNGMKRRLCRGKEDVIMDLWTRIQQPQGSTTPLRSLPRTGRPIVLRSATRRMLSRDLAPMEEKIDLLSWLKNTPEDPTSASALQKESEEKAEEAEYTALSEKVRLLGEYGAYAEALLWPILNDERAERELIHTFVGVVFSLQFPIEVVMSEASRLEAECAKLENEVMHGYQSIMRAELRSRGPDQPMGLPLLRYFTEASDAEFFFKQELLQLNVEMFQRRWQAARPSCQQQDNEGEDSNIAELRQRSAELHLELDILIAKAQRKQRKSDKKAASVEQQVTQLHDAYSRILLASSRPQSTTLQEQLKKILDARVLLETERLRLANVRLKQLDWSAKINDLMELKRTLGDESVSEPTVLVYTFSELDDSEILDKKDFLETQLRRYLVELKSIALRSSTVRAEPTTTELRRQHKSTTEALWTLFITNLFRACCCWMVENLGHQETEWSKEMGEISCDNESREPIGVWHQVPAKMSGAIGDSNHISAVRISEPVTHVVINTFAAARKASAAVRESTGQVAKRRSSLSNARDVLDTMQRSAIASELAEQHANMMRDTYTRSSQLLFESERKAALREENARQQQESEYQQHTRIKLGEFTELNPITGFQERPSSQLVKVEEVGVITDESSLRCKSKLTLKLNSRKRELLRQAMTQNHLERLAMRGLEEERSLQDEKEELACSANELTGHGRQALIDGIIHADDTTVDIAFGNFVMGSPLKRSTLLDRPTCTETQHTDRAAVTVVAEALWKRGGAIRRRGESPTAGPTSPTTAAKASGFEIFASVEDEMAFNTAFRVMSASKDRRTTPQGRRLSSIGMLSGRGLGQISSNEPHRTVEPSNGIDHVGIYEPSDGISQLDSVCSVADIVAAVDRESLTEDVDQTKSETCKVDATLYQPVSSKDSYKDELEQIDLASVVTAAEEVDFFGQAFQQYLDRVRRDSLVVSIEPQVSNLVMIGPNLESQNEGNNGDLNSRFIVITEENTECMRTPHIKWDRAPKPSTLLPLHVKSTRLLPHLGSQVTLGISAHDELVEQGALDELVCREYGERQQLRKQGQSLLLSGKPSVVEDEAIERICRL